MKTQHLRFTFREKRQKEKAILNTDRLSSRGRKSPPELLTHNLILAHMKRIGRGSCLARSIALLVRCAFVVLMGVIVLITSNTVHAVTFVSNFDQPYTWVHKERRVNDLGLSTEITTNVPYAIWVDGGLAQGFRTGSNESGYNVSSVEIHIGKADRDLMVIPSSVSLWSSSGGAPKSLLYTFTLLPDSFVAGFSLASIKFESNAILESDTSYFIVIKSSEQSRITITSSSAEDAGSLAGWSIRNTLIGKDGDHWRFMHREDVGSVFPEGAGVTPALRIGIQGFLLDSRSIIVSLTQVGEGQFKATRTTSVPFDIILPIAVINGTIESGATTVTIPAGSTESDVINVSRTPGTTFPVSVDIGNLPKPPAGYAFFKSPSRLPLQVLEGLSGGITPVSKRTPQVRDAIVAAVRGINSANDVTEAHLAAITTLRVNAPPNQAVRPIIFRIGDFSGLTTLTNLEMERWRGVSLPDGIFDGLNALERVSLYSSGLRSIPNSVLGLTSLKSLNIGYHGITSIPAGVFDQLTQLNTLILDAAAYGNTFTSLPDGVFDKLTSLTRLNLDQNKITSLPDGVFDQLTSLESLSMDRIHSLSSLPDGVFDQLTSLTSLSLQGLKPTSLPDGIFSELSSLTFLDLSGGRLTSLPAGIFSGLSSLTSLYLRRNAVDPLPLTVSLETVGEGQFKAVAPTGAPFDIVLPFSVRNGSISGGANILTIPTGSLESASLTVTRTPGTTAAVTVDIGTLPGLPTDVNQYGVLLHQGYTLVKSDDLPLVAISRLASGITPVSERTSQVRDAIVAAVPGINSADDVTEAHLAAITVLNLNGRNITALKVGDFDGLTNLEELRLYNNQLTTLPEDIFDGLTALTTLRLYGNQLSTLPEDIFDELIALTTLQLGLNRFTTLPSSIFDGLTKLTDLRMIGNQFITLPDGIFDGLTALTTLYLGDNAVNPLPLTVSLEKVGEDGFKATAPTGASFDIVLPLSVRNGSIAGGATTLTIPVGSVESEVLSVTRTIGTSGAVSVRIRVPSLPANHSGYRLANATGEFNRLIIFDDISEQVWSGTVTGGTWGNDFGNGNATGEGYSRYHNAGSISNPTFTYGGTTYTIHGISFSRIGNNYTHRTSLLITPSFPACDKKVLYFGGLGGGWLTDAGQGNAYGASWYLWQQTTANAWPVGHQYDWHITLHPTVPDAPVVTASNEGNQVMLSWETPCDGGIDITGHEYRQKIGNGAFGPWILIPNSAAGEVNATSYTVLNVNNPLESTFEVRAVNELGVSLPSAETIPVSAGFIPVSQRTPQVRDAIVAAVPGVNSANDVTAAHLAAIRFLNLQRKNISALKTGDFTGLSSLITLNLEGNNLTSLPVDIFTGLSSLSSLTLTYNDLTTLPAGVFSNLSSLTSVLLYGNDLTTLPEGVFTGLSSLTELNLYNNDLTTLPAGIFTGLSSLTRLSLGGNQLTTLSVGIFDELSSLTYLYLGDGQLATLPAGVFTGLSSLTELLLHGNQLTTLSVNAFSGLSSLTRLWLQNNSTNPLSVAVSLELVDEGQFKAVAPAGAPFDFVLQISVANGTITGGATSITIPTGNVESEPLTVTRTPGTTAAVTVDIGTLPGLPTNVDPQDRPFHQGYTLVKSTDLPLEVVTEFILFPVNHRAPAVRDAIVAAVPGVNSDADVTEAHLAAITSLSLNNKSLTSLKAGDFYGLKNMGSLYLENNQLTILPEGIFDGLPRLVNLQLEGNQLTALPDGVFDELSSLKTLNLTGNQLATLPGEIFNRLDLLWIDLRDNQLTELSSGVFDGQSSMTSINLDNNQLTALPNGVFDGLSSLTTIDLQNNQLASLPKGIFDGLSSLTTLNLSGNAVDPMPLTVSLEKVADGQFKATAPTGAPFDIVLSLNVTNGTINGGATTITIPAGSVESDPPHRNSHVRHNPTCHRRHRDVAGAAHKPSRLQTRQIRRTALRSHQCSGGGTPRYRQRGDRGKHSRSESPCQN